MAARYVVFLLIILSVNITAMRMFKFKMPDVEGKDTREHLKFNHILKICSDRDQICDNNDTTVCTMRFVDDEIEYKDYNNTCYLFLGNMCDNPGEEYHIIEGITCDQYLSTNKAIRRINNSSKSDFTTKKTTTTKINVTENAGNTNNDSVKQTFNTTEPTGVKVPLLRDKKETTIAPLYEIDTSFDNHICPYTCPNVYAPICIIVNRGQGKYFKYFTFVNHCYGDLYYCKHFHMFDPPPDVDYEDVQSSQLSWSYCASYRYLQFARFTEVVSAMGYYGWLAGPHRYSHIMEPRQRIPGYG